MEARGLVLEPSVVVFSAGGEPIGGVQPRSGLVEAGSPVWFSTINFDQ